MLFIASNRRQLFETGWYADANGRRWRDTVPRGLAARLFSDGGKTMREEASLLLVARLLSTSGILCLLP